DTRSFRNSPRSESYPRASLSRCPAYLQGSPPAPFPSLLGQHTAHRSPPRGDDRRYWYTRVPPEDASPSAFPPDRNGTDPVPSHSSSRNVPRADDRLPRFPPPASPCASETDRRIRTRVRSPVPPMRRPAAPPPSWPLAAPVRGNPRSRPPTRLSSSRKQQV